MPRDSKSRDSGAFIIALSAGNRGGHPASAQSRPGRASPHCYGAGVSLPCHYQYYYFESAMELGPKRSSQLASRLGPYQVPKIAFQITAENEPGLDYLLASHGHDTSGQVVTSMASCLPQLEQRR